MRLSHCLVLALLSISIPAQGLSGVFTPATGTPGSTMVIRLSNGGPNTVYLSSGCGYNSIRSGTPTGPIVSQPLICPLILIPIGPCTSHNTTFQVPASATPGVYYVQVGYGVSPATSGLTDYFPFSVLSPTSPTLTASSPARIGTSLNLSISAPTFPSGAYVAAASFTTNSGFPISPTVFVSLDFDFLFQLSFPAADPFLFTNFSGGLSPTGSATGISVNIPNANVLLWKGLAVQAAVVDALGGVAMTNPLVFSFIP